MLTYGLAQKYDKDRRRAVISALKSRRHEGGWESRKSLIGQLGDRNSVFRRRLLKRRQPPGGARREDARYRRNAERGNDRDAWWSSRPMSEPSQDTRRD